MKQYIIFIFGIIILLSSCYPKIVKVTYHEINGTLKPDFHDNESKIEGLFQKENKNLKICILKKKNFINVLPKLEYDSFIVAATKNFKQKNINIVSSKKLTYNYKVNGYKIDNSLVKNQELDYILVLDSLVDNINYYFHNYYDKNGIERKIPNICYPDTSILNNPKKFEKWSKKKDVLVLPLNEFSYYPMIEMIYGYAKTEVYSGKTGRLLGNINFYISDFDRNDSIPFKFTTKLNKYNINYIFIGDRKINQKLIVKAEPANLYSLFNFGEVYADKVSRILLNEKN